MRTSITGAGGLLSCAWLWMLTSVRVYGAVLCCGVVAWCENVVYVRVRVFLWSEVEACAEALLKFLCDVGDLECLFWPCAMLSLGLWFGL